jgi:hypothetical protein
MFTITFSNDYRDVANQGTVVVSLVAFVIGHLFYPYADINNLFDLAKVIELLEHIHALLGRIELIYPEPVLDSDTRISDSEITDALRGIRTLLRLLGRQLASGVGSNANYSDTIDVHRGILNTIYRINHVLVIYEKD